MGSPAISVYHTFSPYHQLARMAAKKKAPAKKRGREPKGSASKKEPAAKKAKKEEAPAVEYKTVPCKKYWTIGHCELGPKCLHSSGGERCYGEADRGQQR